MRISHQHKFIYVSKPKCASESIRKALNKYSDIRSEREPKSPYYDHTTLKKLKNHFHNIGWDFDSYFKFTTLRNPWDMVVSLYIYAKTDVNGIEFWQNSPDYQPKKLLPFKEWLLRGKAGKFYTLENFIFNDDGNNLADYVICVENLQSDLEFVSSKLGIKLDCYHVNKTAHKKYSDYYDRETKEIVAEIFKLDVEYGGYEF